jgi:hypothetical protein
MIIEVEHKFYNEFLNNYTSISSMFNFIIILRINKVISSILS